LKRLLFAQDRYTAVVFKLETSETKT